MRRALPMLTTVALLVGACSGGSDDTSDSSVASPDTVATTSTASVPAAEAPTTIAAETTTSAAPTTTIDEAALLAEAEAAYLEAFEVSKEILRDPANADNEALIEEHFTGPNLELNLEALELTINGNLVARENDGNPSIATIIEPAEFVDDEMTLARLTVCEFNSDLIYEIGTAPGGEDALRRDDPVSILLVVDLSFARGQWKSASGNQVEEVRDEVERCSGVS